MRITVEELEKNFDYILEKSAEEDIYVIKDGEVISVMTSPKNASAISKLRKELSCDIWN